MTISSPVIQFELPENLACPLPTEERGLRRDDVRLLVTADDGKVVKHSHFHQLTEFLQPGDLLVVNTSATVAAAIPLHLPNGNEGVLHLSNQLKNGRWLVEIRAIENNKTKRWKKGQEAMLLNLPNGGQLQLKQRFYNNHHLLDLWEVDLLLPKSIETYLHENGRAIRYSYSDKHYPLSYYQTQFSTTMGSAEMPSAARGFTVELVEKLIAKGVDIVPVLLHTGVSSLELDEKPYPEYMEISAISAQKINEAKQNGARVIAVGTTAIRALESAVDENNQVKAFKGHTELFIDHDYKMKIADALLTGFHEPEASHLLMLQALVSVRHLEEAYATAINNNYYWHEFGDLHLIFSN